MLRYLYADQLHEHPQLANAMFTDRTEQFKNRLKWDVRVDDKGHERDEYDDLNPLYVIWECADGSHGGSMRFLPTVGRTMVNDHFAYLSGGGQIVSSHIWECTRFCLTPGASSKIAAALMLAGGEIMQGFGIKHFVGVFDARMVRIYRMIGSSPVVLGSAGRGRDQVSVGLWNFSPENKAKVAERAGIPLEVSQDWFDLAFGRKQMVEFAKAG